MRVVQLIDSLEAGGAERMAVSYANSLYSKVDFSGLVVTRTEGNLKELLNTNISYLFLERKKIVDYKALIKLRKYILFNKIDYIHAHSTSIYFAVLLKIFLPNIKIIWHDHYGKSEMLEKRKRAILQFCSFFMNGIISVNHKLKNWADKKLFCRHVIYLPNFTGNSDIFQETTLNGIKGKRIVCLANLRPQKNHFLLLKVAELITKKYPDWTFHLIGKNFNDCYSREIETIIQQKKLSNVVFLYGSRKDILSILKNSTIGVLTSDSEGLPVSLLEYGFAKLPVISTDVGEISQVVKDRVNGLVVNVNDEKMFSNALIELIENIGLREEMGVKLYKKIKEIYSEEPVVLKYLSWINEK